MIFETLSLEYFLAGKPLPWNKVANPEKPTILFEGELDMIRADLTKAKSMVATVKDGHIRFTKRDPNARFNLRG